MVSFPPYTPTLPPFTHTYSPSPPLTHAYNTARLRVEEKYLLPSFTLDTPLEYLIPTTVGAGACTTALTDFLVLTHNNFIETYQGIIEQYQRWGQLWDYLYPNVIRFFTSFRKSQWQEYKVPITHIHDCHLLIYEQQLPSIILSLCHYSLVVGKGQDVSYDLSALEKLLRSTSWIGSSMASQSSSQTSPKRIYTHYIKDIGLPKGYIHCSYLCCREREDWAAGQYSKNTWRNWLFVLAFLSLFFNFSHYPPLPSPHTHTHIHTHTYTYTHTHTHTHHTQTLLLPRMQQQIIQEIGTPDRLRETLDVVDVVLGFLSSGGGKANQSLGEYVNQTLKMKGRRFSGKVPN